MKVGVPKEVRPNERRVALVPESVNKLTTAGIDVLVQAGAGGSAHFLDQAYKTAGATIVPDAQTVFESADVVVKVQRPASNEGLAKPEVEMMRSGAVLIAFLQPLYYPELAKELAERGITSFSMDAVPRIARAQSMDALSSMSSIAGYKAAIIAAESLGIYLPMMVTAAGTTPPAKGLVLGAGVAGLQAIATARRLGAVMQAFDVIVDMAADAGGNCELTKPGETIVEPGVTIHGPLDLPSSVPVHSSQMYSRNMLTLLQHLIADGEMHFDWEDAITKDCCITYDGQVVHEPTLALLA